MNQEALKYRLSSHRSQIIFCTETGIIESSCNTLFDLSVGSELSDTFLFFDSFFEQYQKQNSQEKQTLPCINYHYNGELFLLDIVLHKSEGQFIVLIEDQTENYQKLQNLQQDRNVSNIQEEHIELLKKAKELFFSKVNHELRTPLNSVIGLCHLIKENYQDSQLILTYISALVSSADHLKSIINDILDLSKLESLKMELNPEKHNLKALLDSIKYSFEYQLKMKNLKLEVELLNPDLEDSLFWVDPVRFKQIFINVVNNAIKYSSKGTIRIKAAYRENKAGEGSIRFWIKDEGIGMPPKQVNTIFQDFTQLKSSVQHISRDNIGTGLGLSIVKQLVELHNGKVWATSEESVGTTIHIEMNMKKAKPEPAGKVEAPGDLTGLRCLIVEDDIMNRIVIENIMKRYNASAISCESAESALEILTEHNKFDLVITDYYMDGITGIELKEKFDKLAPESEIKWILLSGTKYFLNDEDHQIKLFDAHFVKPVYPEKLYQELKSLSLS
jgi:signal transduction histidine kinase